VLKGFFFENPKKEFAFTRWKANPRTSKGTTAPGFIAVTVNTVITV
jgi:hypothetical protein